jgi:GTPase SAR1 family protein
MPKIVVGGENPQPINENQETPQVEQSVGETPDAPKHTPSAKQLENDDVETNTIVTPVIIDQNAPLVVFVGPPSSGKTMILVRLAKYLRSNGYIINTDETFLSTEEYKEDCDEFNNKLNTNVALKGTVKFLLVNVHDNTGNLIAKLLEAPGEDFFTTEKNNTAKNKRIEPYLATIMTSANPKSYVVLLDLDSQISFRRNHNYVDAYADRFINYFYPKINNKRDRIVLLYNKIDETPFGNINGCTNPKGARKDAEMYYKQMFATMKVSKLGGFVTADNFVFKTFCTGMFSDSVDDQGNNYQTYSVASDTYPRDLWNEIIRRW